MCKQGAGGRRDDDSVIATIYTNIVRDLGDLVETRLEMKLDAVAAAGNLTKTVKVIRKLLGRMEGKATSSGAARAAAGQRQSDNDFDAAAVAAARAAAGRDPIVGGGGGTKEDRPPAVWIKGKHKPCNLCKTQSDKNHLRKWCPENPTPGVDPVFTAEREAREKGRKEKKNKRQGGARVAAGHTDTDSDDSDTDSNCSDCSEQSIYEEEAAIQEDTESNGYRGTGPGERVGSVNDRSSHHRVESGQLHNAQTPANRPLPHVNTTRCVLELDLTRRPLTLSRGTESNGYRGNWYGAM